MDNRPNIDTQEHVPIFAAAPRVMVPMVLRGGWDVLWDLVALPTQIWAHLVADWQDLKKKLAG